MGLKHGSKASGEVFEEFALFLYLWAQDGTDKGYEMAQKHFLQQTRQHNKKHIAIKK